MQTISKNSNHRLYLEVPIAALAQPFWQTPRPLLALCSIAVRCASLDLRGRPTVALLHVSTDRTSCVASWAVHGGQYYRYLRVVLDPFGNSLGGSALAFNSLEVYGDLRTPPSGFANVYRNQKTVVQDGMAGPRPFNAGAGMAGFGQPMRGQLGPVGAQEMMGPMVGLGAGPMKSMGPGMDMVMGGQMFGAGTGMGRAMEVGTGMAMGAGMGMGMGVGMGVGMGMGMEMGMDMGQRMHRMGMGAPGPDAQFMPYQGMDAMALQRQQATGAFGFVGQPADHIEGDSGIQIVPRQHLF